MKTLIIIKNGRARDRALYKWLKLRKNVMKQKCFIVKDSLHICSS